jgi:hypothetical protein
MHGHRGVLQSLTGPPTPSRPTRGVQARPALHRGPTTTVKPRRSDPQHDDARDGYESGPPGGIDGARQAAAGAGQARASHAAASSGTAPPVVRGSGAARPACTSTTGAPDATPTLPAPQIRGGANQAKRLLHEEQAKRRRLVLYYNCNEPYSRGHNRVCRQIFYIDGVELGAVAPAYDEDDKDAPVFSLRVVAGMPICDTMQVRVTVGAATFTALSDTESTHNFIAEAAASRTGLQAHSDPRLTSMVANGEQISCPGVFRQAPIAIAGEKFCVDLVLGTQWMVTLGSIVWDFTKRTMAFTRQGRPVCWSSTSCCPALGGIFVEPTSLPPQRARDHNIVRPQARRAAGGGQAVQVPYRPQRLAGAAVCHHDIAGHRPAQ